MYKPLNQLINNINAIITSFGKYIDEKTQVPNNSIIPNMINVVFISIPPNSFRSMGSI